MKTIALPECYVMFIKNDDKHNLYCWSYNGIIYREHNDIQLTALKCNTKTNQKMSRDVAVMQGAKTKLQELNCTAQW